MTARTIRVDDWTPYYEGMNQALAIDPQKTVVLTVDMQRKYLDMEIATSPVPPEDAERVLRHARELLDFSRSQGIPVVHVYSTRRPIELEHGFGGTRGQTIGEPLKLRQNRRGPAVRGPDRLIGSAESEVPASLVEPSDVHVTTKKTTDGYLYSDLDGLLSRALKPETVVLTGINTDTCVYNTTFSTATRGYRAVVISDCVATFRGRDAHEMALELMGRSIAWVLTVEQFREKVLARRKVAAILAPPGKR